MVRNRKKGFTLVEMLAVVAIVALVGAAIVVGTNSMLSVYGKIMFHSNSGILEDDINTSIISILKPASCVKNVSESGKTYVFIKSKGAVATSGGDNGARLDVADGVIMLKRQTVGSSTADTYLVNPNAYVGLTVENFTITYTADPTSKTKPQYNGVVTVSYDIISEDGQFTRECGITYRTQSQTTN